MYDVDKWKTRCFWKNKDERKGLVWQRREIAVTFVLYWNLTWTRMPIIIQETSNRVHEPTNIVLCIWINRTLLVLYDWRSLQRYKAKKCVEFLAIDVNYVYVFVCELVAYLPSCHHNHHCFVKTRAQIISIQLKAYSVQQDTVANRFVHSFVLWFEIRSASYFFLLLCIFPFFSRLNWRLLCLNTVSRLPTL